MAVGISQLAPQAFLLVLFLARRELVDRYGLSRRGSGAGALAGILRQDLDAGE
jgi:hypothetical protein